jgi:hypothetical protein
MRSPFPGMDPWLEAHWRDVHTRLMVYAVDELQGQLPADLFARVEEGVSVDYGEESRSISPDVRVVETPGSGLWPIAATASAATVAEPMIVPADEPETERHIEVVDASSGNRVVTAIEVLSASNKTPFEGREKYLQKQQEYLAGDVNLVEIDLIRCGIFTVAFGQKGIPKRRHTPYCVCVRRVARPGMAEVYRMPLRESLPTIRIPLRPADGDVTLNLQRLIDQAYMNGRYGATLNYSQSPEPALSEEDSRWANQILQSAR